MKITERDKVLLVLLAVILVVALAIVLPGVGVLACRDKLAEISTDSEELQQDLDAKRATLREMGVVQNPESYSRAVDELKETVFDLKVEASHLAGNVMAYAKPYALDEDWIDGLEYRYGIKSDEGEKLIEYNPFSDVDSAGGNEQNEVFSIEGTTYTLPSAKREIKYSISSTMDCLYNVEMIMDDYPMEKLGSVLLFLHNISSKGSILITGLKYAGENIISFTLLMPPEGSGITRYAQEVVEELARRAAEEAGELPEEEE